MSKTPVIEIDVQDGAFQKFKAAFEDYQTKLKDMPKEWQQVNKRITEFATLQTAAGVSADRAWANATKAAHDYTKAIKGAGTAQSHLARGTDTAARAMTHMARDAKLVSGHLFTAVRFAAKLGGMLGLGAGLVGGGLTFGLDELANGVMARQRAARGLGLTTGQYQSWRANMARYAGSNVLQGAAEAQTDLSKAGWLAMAGVSWNQARSESATRLAEQEVLAAHSAWRANPTVQNPKVQALMHLGMSLGDIRTAGAGSRANILKAIAATNSNAGVYNLSNSVQRQWSEFAIQLHKAGLLIDTALIKTLAPLGKPLTKLSAEVANLVVGLEKSGDVKKWVNDIGDGLKDAAKFLGSPAFRADMRTIAYDFDALAKKLGHAVTWIVGKPTSQAGTNNPFNIERNGKLAAYSNQRAGVLAAFEAFEHYPGKYHLHTVGEMLKKFKGPWGGKGDMHSAQYISMIAKGAGTTAGATMPLADPAKMAKIMHYQSIAEGHPVPESAIYRDLLGYWSSANLSKADRQKLAYWGGNAAPSAAAARAALGTPDHTHAMLAKQAEAALPRITAPAGSAEWSRQLNARTEAVWQRQKAAGQHTVGAVRNRYWQTHHAHKIKIENNTAAQTHISANAAAW